MDIVPFEAGDNMPIDHRTNKPMVAEGDWAYTYEYWVHRGVGPLNNETVICPERTYKQPCPLCEHRRELIAEKAFDAEKMGELLCKQRNLYNVICYDTDKEERKGVQLLDVANFYFEKHISKLATKPVHKRRGSKTKSADPFKNFADPSDNGVSIEFSIEAAKSKNDFDTWMGHQLIERDYDLDEEWLGAALQLDQIVDVKSYEELYQVYYDEEYKGDDDDEEEEEESPRGRRRRRRSEEEEAEEIDEDEYAEEPEEDEEEEEQPRRRRGRSSSRRRDTKKKLKKNVCPEGGEFGTDFEEFDACDNCPNWDACEEASGEVEEEEEEED